MARHKPPSWDPIVGGRRQGHVNEQRLRVVDPVAFAIQVPSPAALGVRHLARAALLRAVAPMELGYGVDRAAVEAAVVPVIEERLARAGTVDDHVRVTRVVQATVNEADERAVLVSLGGRWLRPDPDVSGSHTITGDIGWAMRRVGRMARWELLVVAAATIVVQFVGLRGVTPWSPFSLLVGMSIGIMAAPFAELRGDLGDVFRKAGRRRTMIWVALLAAWTIATLGIAFGPGPGRRPRSRPAGRLTPAPASARAVQTRWTMPPEISCGYLDIKSSAFSW